MPVLIERLPSSAYNPREELTYVDVHKLHPLFDKLAFRASLLLEGPKGVAKSLAIAAYASKHNIPIVTFDCSEDARRAQIVGMYTIRGSETPFVLGALTTAYEVANEVGRCIIDFEEFNTLTPQMQKLLNSSTDFRKRIEVPECGRVFELQPMAKLWVVGTQNHATYAGTYSINEDLKSRLRIVEVGYPSSADEAVLISKVADSMGIQANPKVINSLCHIANESRQTSDGTEYHLSTRDIVQILEDGFLLGDMKAALRIALGKFAGADRDWFQTRIKSAFGFQITAQDHGPA